jgi:hypothetical protein
VRTAWDFHDGTAWRTLDPGTGAILDDTRGLTLAGPVIVTPPAALGAVVIGAVAAAHFYLRCRLVAGPPDEAPALLGVAVNATQARQTSPARATFPVLPGAVVGMPPQAGTRVKLDLDLDDGRIKSLALAAAAEAPEVFVLGFTPPAGSKPGAFTTTLVPAGRGTGLPCQRVTLPGAPITGGAVEVWTREPPGWRRWQQRPDFDASRGTDGDFTLDPMAGLITFGDGWKGRVVGAGVPVLVQYEETAAGAGNLGVGASWALAGADDALNAALLGGDPAAVAAGLGPIVNRAAAAGGRDAEDLEHAAGRAVEALWAHERLVELCPAGRETLDGLPRGEILARTPPQRAATLLDFERLALDVPGTRLARARASAGIDPAAPCLLADGTVLLIIVPWLPRGRPRPGAGLLRAVRRGLEPFRVIGTRLVVVGPEYLAVGVRATVRVRDAARRDRVRAAVVAALNAFLDPLTGGPDGRGWPFGRDVYRSEVFQVILAVPGVDCVTDLALVGDPAEPQCGNLCVPPTWLVTPGTHAIAFDEGGQS